MLRETFARTAAYLTANNVESDLRLGRPLRISADATEIEGDPDATRLLEGTYREGYGLPEVG